MHSDMSKETKDQILNRLRRLYATAGLPHKAKLLNQAVELLGYHRKAAIRAMGRPKPKPVGSGVHLVLGQPQTYHPERLLPILKPIWFSAIQPCGSRLQALLPEWLPEGFSYERIAVTANANGPLANISHSGQIKVEGFVRPGLNPITAQGRWGGTGGKFRIPRLELAAGTSTLLLSGSADLSGLEKELRVTQCTLRKRGETVWQLEQPWVGSWRNSGEPSAGAKFATELHWAGPGHLQASAQVQWPRSGQISLSARNIDLRAFEDFLGPTTRAWRAAEIDFAASWNGGPLIFQLHLDAQLQAHNEPTVAARVNLRGE